ncbi:hypothetical protein ACJMK2_012087 [Sinanodonta woodiana]|uniref:Calcineurin-like phosphoesterase domain-containing protein n=1 Tax=Sinanodonta woodiana TaxID=1069815 RepID=A0ABD3V9Z1_SINWO
MASHACIDEKTVIKVGAVDNPSAKCVRIVHVSDTHMMHNEILLPNANILVHSGDFSKASLSRLIFRSSAFEELTREIDIYFEKVPIKHKLLVAGNHEVSFPGHSANEIQSRLQHVTYLQDSSLEVEGIKFYGSPWTSNRWYSLAKAFTEDGRRLIRKWEKIPSDTDVLVTHMPPLNIGDLAAKIIKVLSILRTEGACRVCNKRHVDFDHWGCQLLLDTVLNRVRPKIHMYGHVHESNGVISKDGIVFSNAAYKLSPNFHVFDYYVLNSVDQ